MTLYVDKLQPNDLGAITRDINKIKHTLGKLNVNVNELIDSIADHTVIPTSMFDAGRYIIIFQFNRTLTSGSMAFFNYTIDLKKNFDSFADSLSPKVVAGFYEMQKHIQQKSDKELSSVELSEDMPSMLELNRKSIQN